MHSIIASYLLQLIVVWVIGGGAFSADAKAL